MLEEGFVVKRSPSALLVVIAIGVFVMLPGAVRAETTVLGPDSYHNKTHSLKEGDVLNWNWHVEGDGDVDFWVEDGEGTKHFSLYNATQSDSWLIIPEDGDWTYVFRNDAVTGPAVTVEYDVDIVPESEAEEFLSTLIWGFALVGVIMLILIVMVAWVLLRRERPEKPQR